MQRKDVSMLSCKLKMNHISLISWYLCYPADKYKNQEVDKSDIGLDFFQCPISLELSLWNIETKLVFDYPEFDLLVPFNVASRHI